MALFGNLPSKAPMRRWFDFRSDLGLQLLALYLLLIVPFLVTLWIFDGWIGVRIREDVQASDLSLARSISQEADLAISKSLSVVQGLAGVNRRLWEGGAIYSHT